METLVEFWRRCDLAQRPLIHPDDLEFFRKYHGMYNHVEHLEFSSFLKSDKFGDFDDTKFHTSLLPIPFSGDVENAQIIILLLNPGFQNSDYYAETHNSEFRIKLENNIQQNFETNEYPFIWLDPKFCWHSGFVWWEQKLRGVLSLIARKKFRNDYIAALQSLSTRIAHVELVPYRSRSFGAHKLIDKLPSAMIARQYVKNTLVTDANEQKRWIIVTRQEAAWRIPPDTQNVIVYRGGQTRGASLSPNSAGGQRILSLYDI